MDVYEIYHPLFTVPTEERKKRSMNEWSENKSDFSETKDDIEFSLFYRLCDICKRKDGDKNQKRLDKIRIIYRIPRVHKYHRLGM